MPIGKLPGCICVATPEAEQRAEEKIREAKPGYGNKIWPEFDSAAAVLWRQAREQPLSRQHAANPACSAALQTST